MPAIPNLFCVSTVMLHFHPPMDCEDTLIKCTWTTHHTPVRSVGKGSTSGGTMRGTWTLTTTSRHSSAQTVPASSPTRPVSGATPVTNTVKLQSESPSTHLCCLSIVWHCWCFLVLPSFVVKKKKKDRNSCTVCMYTHIMECDLAQTRLDFVWDLRLADCKCVFVLSLMFDKSGWKPK